MSAEKRFFSLLGIDNKASLQRVAKESAMSQQILQYYNENNILPSGDDLEKVLRYSGFQN
jgi:hypothetical protein